MHSIRDTIGYPYLLETARVSTSTQLVEPVVGYSRFPDLTLMYSDTINRSVVSKLKGHAYMHT